MPAARRFLCAVATVLLTCAALVAAAPTAAVAAAPGTVVGGVDLGPNVRLFTPDMSVAQIKQTVDAIAAEQAGNQFGAQRYALLFAPGTYGTPSNPLNFEVGYYTEVAGLGRNPGDVVVNGSIDVYNQCSGDNCIALNNFWRSLSNLTINVAGKTGCHGNTEFWAVSQASSMRRVVVNGAMSFMDYCTGPAYASGGFVADSKFSSTAINGSQQQFLVRNSSLNGWSNGVWNQVFVGTQGAPAEQFGPGTNQYTTVGSTPLQQEKPYLYLDGAGKLAVFQPSSARDTSGTSWASGSTPGTSLPLSSFQVVTASTTLKQMNKAVQSGRNLLITPGVYELTAPLHVTYARTVVLGLGLPTLVPTTGKTAIDVDGTPGVKLGGLILDAGAKTSPTLLHMAYSRNVDRTSPTLLQDVYLRVGGARAGSVRTAAAIETTNVVIDNLWAWRADHGTGVGWTQNTATTGLRVTGRDVIAYGLFVEHFQGDEVVWNNTGGRVYMFQNELPYDVPSQQAWNTSATVKGHVALRVAKDATGFRGYGLGSYSYFSQGVDIRATQAFTFDPRAGAAAHHLLTVFLDGSGGIDSVVNGRGAPVTRANQGTPSTVADF